MVACGTTPGGSIDEDADVGADVELLDSARTIDASSDAHGAPDAVTDPLTANDGLACIEVAPTLDFGAVRRAREYVEDVTITHCGDRLAPNGETLVVSDLRWDESESDSVFVLWPQPIALPLELAPGESRNVSVWYQAPGESARSRSVLQIESNDLSRPQVDVEVTGRAVVDPNCPTAEPLCTVRGSGVEPTNWLDAAPLDVVDCDGSTSAGLGGAVVQYRWELLHQPPGSTTYLETPAGVSTPLFLDVPGFYELQLTTVDDDGCVSPSTGRVRLFAKPYDDLRVEVVWDTPADPDQTDSSGSDMDIHLLHSSGCWGDGAWDCHSRSISPNWGDRSHDGDDPIFWVDDVDGSGPESIDLLYPEDGVIYRVGAHYWNDWGYGASIATVRIYRSDALVFEQSREMASTGQFWDAATIAWPSGEIVSVDTLYDDIADAVCP